MTNSWQLRPHQAPILIIDDEPVNLKLLQKMLHSLGYNQLHLIQDPRDALTAYLMFKPHLVLLDLNMPHLNGFDVMKQFSESDSTIKPPIVVLTASSDRETRLRALNDGARDFIGKPLDLAELQIRVRNLLEAHMAHRMVYDQKAVLDQMVLQRTEELSKTRLQVINRLGLAAGYRDDETGEHITRVSGYSRLIAQQLGWNNHACQLIHDAAPMHDIGKIGIPDEVLLKPGKLTHDEFEIIKQHPTIGAELLGDDGSDLMQMAYSIALTHHEKWDGTGYPQGLKGEKIPIEGRIVAVADVFDAVTSVRPYKRAWSFDEATDYIKANAGGHFDPEVVNCFLNAIDDVRKIYHANQDDRINSSSAA